jgi:hypothetical protein
MFQPPVSLRCLAALSLPRALVVSRTHCPPGSQMAARFDVSPGRSLQRCAEEELPCGLPLPSTWWISDTRSWPRGCSPM